MTEPEVPMAFTSRYVFGAQLSGAAIALLLCGLGAFYIHSRDAADFLIVSSLLCSSGSLILRGKK